MCYLSEDSQVGATAAELEYVRLSLLQVGDILKVCITAYVDGTRHYIWDPLSDISARTND